MRFRQLLPAPADIEVEALLEGLEPGAGAPGDRPRVAVNFVASSDGHVTVGGRSAPLGDDGDHAMFHGLRERFDALLAGTNTMGIERYGRALGDPERRRRREARGEPPEPLVCLVSRSGELPLDIPLFDEAEARVVVFSPGRMEEPSWRAQVEEVELHPHDPPLATALRRLRSDFGIRAVLCEGGPTLFGALLAEGLVDELFLTLAPVLTGGSGPSVSRGLALSVPVDLELAWLLERNGYLYLRYVRTRT
jgi:riboflavin biosynthesis pyrimidine reductase